MNRTIVIGVAGVILMAGIYTMIAYLANLGDAPPLIEQEKKGRAQYLIDTRRPLFKWDWIFDWNWQGNGSDE